jgi:hypothetical protein
LVLNFKVSPIDNCVLVWYNCKNYKMSTNVFQVEVGNLLRDIFPVSERMDDAAGNRFGGFQVSKKPYDYFGSTTTGRFWCAEAKKVQEIRFPFRNLESHQRIALAKAEDNNALAFVFINWRYKRAGEAIWITFEDYCNIEYRVLSSNRKSLLPNHFDENWFLTRKTGGWSVPENHNLYKLI